MEESAAGAGDDSLGSQSSASAAAACPLWAAWEGQLGVEPVDGSLGSRSLISASAGACAVPQSLVRHPAP